MNRLSSKWRKRIYLVGILILLIPIIWLGKPPADAHDQGGKLAELRAKYDLGENQLGKIDPTSAAMNLVLLGFRGVATNLIWVAANDNQDTKNWAELRANADAIIMLQPHFVKVWQFLGWNLAYNVSAAWDLVADRYYWVKEGAKVLKRGCVINNKVAQLPYEEGRILGTKIGRADEWRTFRKYFKVKDPNVELFKGRPDPELNPEGKDNYLAAKDQYLTANVLEREFPNTISMLEVLFRSYPYRSQLSYPDALQQEGTFDEVSQAGWQEGYREWTGEFGQESFQGNAGTYHLEMSDRDMKDEAAAQNIELPAYHNWVIRMQNETRYPYWKTRAQLEGTAAMVEAHRLIYDGEQQFRKGNLPTARATLLRGMAAYQQLLDQYKVLTSSKSDALANSKYDILARDDESVEEGLMAVLFWQKILRLQFEKIPDQYPLKDLWTKQERRHVEIEARFKRETGTN